MARKQRYPKAANSIFVKEFTPKNGAQEYYKSELESSTICVASGPAGTSKTYVAVYVALEALVRGEVDKIILTRPIVATEDIGFLPGDMGDKIDPYMQPLYDAIEDHVGTTKMKDLIESGQIKIVPLAFMRGRSLNKAFIILDEAQNTTVEQMKMFLTRLGYESRMAINGDLTQIDLPKHVESGFPMVVQKFSNGASTSITVVEFNYSHIVRNPLIQEMLTILDGPVHQTEYPSHVRVSRGLGVPSLLGRKST